MATNILSHIFLRNNADTVVAFDETRCYTHKDFLGAIATLTEQLQTNPAQRWLLAHDNTYQFAIGLFALWAANKAVLLPPNTQLGTLNDLREHADAILRNVDTSIDTKNSDIAHTPTVQISSVLDAQHITLLTSGSTGAAKMIHKPLHCLSAEISALETQWGQQLGDAAILATVSHQHIYGLLFRLLWPLCMQRPFATYTHSYPEPLIADVQRVTSMLAIKKCVLASSPSQLKRFPPSIDLSGSRHTIAAIFSSGDVLPYEAAQDWQQRLGTAPLEILGSTETGGVAWRSQTQKNTAWQALPDVQITTDAEQTLWVQSPFTGQAQAIAMGDRINLNNDGHFHLLGRADRLAKIEGKRVSLTEMEQKLCATDFIAEARVLLLPTGRLGVVAILNGAGKNQLRNSSKAELIQILRQHLSQYFERVALPRKWRFLDSLPLDSQGKTSHAALVQLFEQSAAMNEAPSTNNTLPINKTLLLQCLQNSDSLKQWRVHLPVDSGVFDGHFPDLPILPGVMQFDLAVRQCAAWYPLHTFRRIDKLKFQEPVIPNDTILLTLENLGNGQVQFTYTLDNTAQESRLLSSGRIIFTTHDTMHTKTHTTAHAESSSP
jgi:acyl-CoA synthetase (AMP-forming)/AMP-acid ligase II/3-hydroxymyristoyl/3-hydroxydecanoyl-(acyl carrier protein) dehydratase